MKTTNLLRLLTVALFASVIAVSCQKDKSEALSPQEEQEASMAASQSEAESEAIFNSIFDDVMGTNDEVGLGGTGIFGGAAQTDIGIASRPGQVDSIPSCLIITVTRPTANPFPVRIELDFGTGCFVRGHMRSGKIITEYTNRLIFPGAVATTVFQNYKIDSISVRGTHKITNTSTSNMRQFTVEIRNARLTRPNGNYSEWNRNRVITQIEGLGTPQVPLDDVFRITGDAWGTINRNNLVTTWESVIIEPLIKRFNCRWIVRGEVKIIRRNQSSNSPWIGYLKYGTGTCDNLAILTVNGVDHQITLH